MGGQGKWEMEIGDESPLRNVEVEGMMESSTNVRIQHRSVACNIVSFILCPVQFTYDA